MATSRPATRILGIRRVVVRVGSLYVMPPFKAAGCCQHVSGFRYADDMRRLVASRSMRVLLVEDEPYMAEAIRDGLRLEAIAADIAGEGDTALKLLGVNAYDIAVLDRDIPGPSGDEIAERIVASGSGMPILMLTAADRLDDKASGFELGADDYLTKPFELRELVLRLRALDRRRAHNRPPVREIAGLRLDPFRREIYRDGRYVALTRKQFAVLEVLVAAEGGVVSAEELLERAWDGNADPFTNAVRITVSALRKRLGEPWLIATMPGVGYRIDTEHERGDRG
jgi:two-component system response regulator VanR